MTELHGVRNHHGCKPQQRGLQGLLHGLPDPAAWGADPGCTGHALHGDEHCEPCPEFHISHACNFLPHVCTSLAAVISLLRHEIWNCLPLLAKIAIFTKSHDVAQVVLVALPATGYIARCPVEDLLKRKAADGVAYLCSFLQMLSRHAAGRDDAADASAALLALHDDATYATDTVPVIGLLSKTSTMTQGLCSTFYFSLSSVFSIQTEGMPDALQVKPA